MVARKVQIYGRVQGVFFRQWAVNQARELGVSGWVRNRADGSVEILAAGQPQAVEALIELCELGPPAAEVERVDVDPTDEQAGSGFTKKPTL